MWAAAWAVSCAAWAFYLRLRVGPAFALALATLFVLGAVRSQARLRLYRHAVASERIPQSEADVTAHVIAEQLPITEASGEFRQRVDLQLESISYDDVSVLEKTSKLWSASDAVLMDAMIAGKNAFIARSTRTDFQRSGIYHVLVVSGMNVTILAFVIFFVLRRMSISDAWASLVTLAIIVFYALLTEVGAPVWRATLMLAVYLVTRWFYGQRSMLNALGMAALGLLLFDPQLLFGSVLSAYVLCVWLGAAVGTPVLERTLQHMCKELICRAVRPNNVSLVFKISFGRNATLLEGDAEKRAEEQFPN